MNKKQHILKHTQVFFNRTICDKEDLMIFSLKYSFLDINSKWCKKYVEHYYFNKMYNIVCFLMKMINQELFITVKYKDA